MTMIPRWLTIAVELGFLPARLAAQSGPARLIEFGWDRPQIGWAVQHAAAMDSSPFDGVVFQLRSGPRFLARDYDLQGLVSDSAALSGLRFRHLRDNFVVLNLTPDRDWTWSDDSAWVRGLARVERIARIARAGALKGIFLDLESYGVNPWRFADGAGGTGTGFDGVAQLARQRGRSLMTTMQRAFPEVVILAPFLLSYQRELLDSPDSTGRARRMVRDRFGLIGPFINGMLDSIRPGVILIDGNEAAYSYRDSQEFFHGRSTIQQDMQELVDPANRGRYQAQVEPGQSIFVDLVLGLRTPPGPAARLAPEDRLRWLTQNVYYALVTSSRYAWLYSQKMDWWRGSLPPGADSAVREGLRRARTKGPLGFTLRPVFRAAGIAHPPVVERR